SFSMGVESIKNGYIDFKRRGVKIRFITEITKDNIHYCKELMKFVEELRHMDGVKGNMAVSETEYVATAVLQESQPVTQTIYSNAKAILEQHRYFFENLWNNATPAAQRIKEIEEGMVPIRTKILENQDEIVREIRNLNCRADHLSICSSLGGMQMSYKFFLDTYRGMVCKYRKKEQFNKLRWIIDVDKDSIQLVKVFLELGFQIRHVKNMLPINFGVSDKEVALTIEKMEGGKMSSSFLISNEPLYVNHFNSLFEEVWKNGIDAIERIKDIEAGVDLNIEVIPSSLRAQERYIDIVKSSSKEILWIFPTANAFLRQDKMGAIPLAIQAAQERNVKVNILAPVNDFVEQKIQQVKQNCPLGTTIDVKYIERTSDTKATILVVDRKDSLVMELKDDSKTTFAEAIGLSTYSNSKAGVLSYVSIFENLWKQSELYEQLMKAHEQLQIHDKMQKEFINIAAHELRTPIQPIIGLSEVVIRNAKDMGQAKLLEVINRNAKRLHRLTEDILDVTKIESRSLNLNKEQFDLNGVITNAIEDLTTKKVPSPSYPTIKLFNGLQPQDISVYADKGRISQVVSNLLDNAIKFTKAEDNITVMIKKEGAEGQAQNNNNEQVIVSIKDTGTGIDPEILPRLFTKFVTKSQTGGTGLGLFICKGIVEAHGGRMWAENNKDGEKGATFYFTLPLTR
ncbi:MAG: HAMP domain-containing histidine kinase, partial [Thermoproteota archaeon]|nr:HAMP domain-containing histidine kinase [Thermoproteota archaeon]